VGSTRVARGGGRLWLGGGEGEKGGVLACGGGLLMRFHHGGEEGRTGVYPPQGGGKGTGERNISASDSASYFSWKKGGPLREEGNSLLFVGEGE